MPVPKKRTSKARRDTRRAHDALTGTFANICSKCGEPVQRHHACKACGYYRGKKIIEIAA